LARQLRDPIVCKWKRNLAADSLSIFGYLLEPFVHFGRKVDFTASAAHTDRRVINIDGASLVVERNTNSPADNPPIAIFAAFRFDRNFSLRWHRL